MKAALAAGRAAAVLSFLTVSPQRSSTLTELSRALGVSPASMSAVLLALENNGYVARDIRRKTYTLGPALLPAGMAASSRYPVLDLARPEMVRLTRWGRECVASAVVGEQIIMLATEGRPSGRGHDLWVGQRIPLLPPLGQVFLPWVPARTRERWLDRVSDDHVETRRRLADNLESVRERGYAVSLMHDRVEILGDVVSQLAVRPRDARLQQRWLELARDLQDDYTLLDTAATSTYSVAALSVPVFDADGIVIALTLYDIPEITGGEIQAIAQEMLASARLLTRELGGRGGSRGRGTRPPLPIPSSPRVG